MALKYVQTLTLYQAGAGNIIGATSVVLTALTDIYGNAITTMAPFGTKGYITLEPDTTNEEGATFTGLTVNANGTVSLTGVSTILAQSPYTEASGLVRTHSGGSKVVITDNVAFWNTFANKGNDEVVTGKFTFPNGANRPILDADTDTATAAGLVTLGQLSRQAIAGAANASPTVKGLVQEATQAQTDARTAAGSTGAELYINPATLRSTKLSDYIVDTGSANLYLIAPTPAITAYAAGQTFTFKASFSNTAACNINVNGLGGKSILKGAGATTLAANDITSGQVVTVIYDGTSFQLQSPVANNPTVAQTVKFGGTGADGALAIAAGVTTIDLAGARVLVKNYTSIAITGTASLAFTNPHANGTSVFLLSQGNVTLTSSATPMIDCSKLGAIGGVSTVGINAGNVAGNIGSEGQSFIYQSNPGAGAGTGAGGVAGAISTAVKFVNQTTYLLSKYADIFVGAGGGSGSANDVTNDGTAPTGGRGGRGGGALVIECAGAWNFTTANGISVAAENGVNGVAPGTGSGAGGGGAGGSAGFFRALYNTLTANSGTVNVSAGTGANSGVTGGTTCYGGGGAGNPLGGGGNGSPTSSDATKNGGDGIAGFSSVMFNSLYA